MSFPISRSVALVEVYNMRRSASTYIAGTIDLSILADWSDDEDSTPISKRAAAPFNAISTATSTSSNAARKRDASAISNAASAICGAAPPIAKAMPKNSTIAPRRVVSMAGTPTSIVYR